MLFKTFNIKSIEFVDKSYYGSHYKTAIQVFNNHKLYGVGLKNYRLEVQKESILIYHQFILIRVHFEVLAELGSMDIYILFFYVCEYFKVN